MSDTRHYRIDYEINPYMSVGSQPDAAWAATEHESIVTAHRRAGRTVEYLSSAPECPDMVYTANTAVVIGDRAVLGQPPGPRRPEIPYAKAWLEKRGYDVIEAPYPFSGQGDALPCGPMLLAGSGQRTDLRMHAMLEDHLGVQVVPLCTSGPLWYDLDLAVAVIDAPDTIAYCPEALDEASVNTLHGLGLDLIKVTVEEAANFALNLISDGTTVTMTTGAPMLAADLRDRGLHVVELDTTELRKGGGGVRCTALTLGTK
ncbi:dimethylarginine dimethylaminohydrolase family protein [Mycobacterium sp. URHB0021]